MSAFLCGAFAVTLIWSMSLRQRWGALACFIGFLYFGIAAIGAA